MRRLWAFLKAHYRAYSLLLDYLSAVKHAGWDVVLICSPESAHG